MKRYFQIAGEQRVITLDLHPATPVADIAAQLGKQLRELAPCEKRELDKKMGGGRK